LDQYCESSPPISVLVPHLLSRQGDIILVGLREFQDGKADIIHKYTTEEARNLVAYGELPASAKINQTAIDMAMDDGEEEEDMGFDFDEI
jgi:translation initiation factor 1A